MKKIIALFSLLTLIFPVSFNAIAIDEKECSIWLCLPAGFPSGCSDAKSAVKKRIKKGKSPLPAFPSCSVETGVAGESTITAYQGVETEILPHKECVRWNSKAKKNKYKDRYCAEWKEIPHEFVLKPCPLPRSPVDYRRYCKQRNLAQVYENGVEFGDKFYW